jgi:hypothetical protein
VFCSPERAQQQSQIVAPFQGLGPSYLLEPRAMPWAVMFQPFRLKSGRPVTA